MEKRENASELAKMFSNSQDLVPSNQLNFFFFSPFLRKNKKHVLMQSSLKSFFKRHTHTFRIIYENRTDSKDLIIYRSQLTLLRIVFNHIYKLIDCCCVTVFFFFLLQNVLWTRICGQWRTNMIRYQLYTFLFVFQL